MDRTEDLILDKQCSLFIKGIAILFMVVHHVMGLPEIWFEEGLGYGQQVIGSKMLYQWIGNPTKICVGVFAFLSGWIYYYHNTPTIRYGVKKTVQLFLQYWMILFLLFYPSGYLINGYIPSWKDLIFNVFCIHNRAVCFSWYVLFYGLCMCSLPILVKLVTDRPLIDFTLLPVIFTVIGNAVQRVSIQKWYLMEDLHDYFYWMPVIWIGYLFAHYGLYKNVRKFSDKKYRFIFVPGIVLIPVMRGAFSEIMGMNLDVLYAPAFIFCCFFLLNRENIAVKAFRFLGKYSLYIWLIHSIFFWKETRGFFQPMVYSVKIPIITVCLVILISLFLAVIFNCVWNKFSKAINSREDKK